LLCSRYLSLSLVFCLLFLYECVFPPVLACNLSLDLTFCLSIYTHQPKIVNNICSQSWCSVLRNSCYRSTLFTCLLSLLMCFPPLISCNFSLVLYCVCPWCNYLYLHCAVSAIGLVPAVPARK
jgi:hypothetical protein